MNPHRFYSSVSPFEKLTASGCHETETINEPGSLQKMATSIEAVRVF